MSTIIFLYAAGKCRVRTRNADRRLYIIGGALILLAARETDEGEENPIFNAFNSPSLSTPKFARVGPLNPWTRIQLVPTWNYGFVTTWGQHLYML